VAHQNQDDTDNIVLVDKWETKDAFESYLAWRQETGVLDQLVSVCVGPPSIRFYDIADA
jgi:quinol monooxygenase YgiN